jgi:hypothetical protein
VRILGIQNGYGCVLGVVSFDVSASDCDSGYSNCEIQVVDNLESMEKGRGLWKLLKFVQ